MKRGRRATSSRIEGTVYRGKNSGIPNCGSNCKKMIKSGKWADLPQELLDLISNDLNIADYLNFGKVCRSWRLFYSEYKQRFMASQSPLIIYMSTRAKQSCYFYDIFRFKSNKYKTKLPIFVSSFNFCIGVSSGYLIMKDLFSSYFWLINPVTGHQLNFSRMPHPPDPYAPSSCNDRAIFATIGSQNQDFLIMILSKKLQSLQFCRSRDNQWIDYSYSDKHRCILDIVVFYGRIFAITDDSQIGIFKSISSKLKFMELKGAPRLSSYVKLVASKKRLLAVDFLLASKIGVYEIKPITREWINVKNLGEHALFLGAGDLMWSKLINPAKWGGPSNCIYQLLNDGNCNLFSLNGEFLRKIRVVQGDFFPRAYSWYFLPESNRIDNVKDD